MVEKISASINASLRSLMSGQIARTPRKKLIKTVCLGLIFLILFYCSPAAFAFNEQKLLDLKPLLSERLAQKNQDYEERKIWPALGLGLFGASVISVNMSEAIVDEDRLFNMMMGWLCVSIGTSLFFSRNEFAADQEVLESLGVSGVEKEKHAYHLFKGYSEREKTKRQNAGLALTIASVGFGLLPALAKDAGSDYKTLVSSFGLIYLGVGLYQYFMPSQAEIEFEKIEEQLQAE